MSELLMAIAMWCSINAGTDGGFATTGMLGDRKGACQKKLLSCIGDEGDLRTAYKKQFKCFSEAAP